MQAIDMVCKGTMKAFAELARRNQATVTDYAKATECLRSVVQSHLDEMLAEWQQAIDANMDERWLRTIINTQCTAYALEAWDLYHK